MHTHVASTPSTPSQSSVQPIITSISSPTSTPPPPQTLVQSAIIFTPGSTTAHVASAPTLLQTVAQPTIISVLSPTPTPSTSHHILTQSIANPIPPPSIQASHVIQTPAATNSNTIAESVLTMLAHSTDQDLVNLRHFLWLNQFDNVEVGMADFDDLM